VKVEWVTVGPFQENCYLVVDEPSRTAVLVDPGDDGERIVRMVQRAGVTPQAVWLTHAHLDHIGAVSAVRREWKVPVLLHPDDLVIYRRGAQSAAAYGLPFDQPSDPDGSLTHGQVLQLGNSRFTVHHTPGHAPGHVVFLGDGVMLGGDLLFAGSIGRTDLPLCNPAAMEASLNHVASFDPETVVYPGHGPATTIAEELASNPFLAGARTTI
jgi:glyoxylase-like metal-dependent hydrolase (beta-lactamase superfamily II)